MFGDKSPRTKRIAKNAISVVLATGLITVGSIGYSFGSYRFNQVVARSSTPIGTSMQFQRSESTVFIKDIYTDKSNSVLIARLGDEAGSRLPYKGSDFRIYVASESTEGLKSMPILFGRMSTDGDLFLVIPNPTKAVYSIFVMNTNFLGVSEKSLSEDNNVDVTKGSISKALSNYRYSDKQSSSGTYEVQDDNYDVVSFRLTLNPAFDTENYRPKVIDSQLLTKNEDGTQSFEFEEFFNTVFKESAIKTTREQYNQLDKKKSQIEKVMEEYSERLSENGNDEVAKSSYEQLKNQLEDIKSKQKQYAKTIADYKLLEYDKSYFNDLQTKAVVIPMQQ